MLFAISCASQQSKIPQADLTINSKQILLGSYSNLISTFGQPSSEADYFYEIEDINGKIVNYNGAKFFIKENKVVGFEITSNSFSITKHNLIVGDSISRIETLFNSSYNNADFIRKTITIQLSEIDYFLNISYSSSNHKVIGFSLVSP